MTSKTIEEIYKIYDSNLNGLSELQVKDKLSKNGKNTLIKQKNKNPIVIFLKQLMDPLVYVLLAAFILSILLKEYSDAIIIISVVLINSIISTIQEIKANKAVSSLNKLTILKCLVRRNNAIKEINSEELVTGDIVLLRQGSNVPADIRLISSSRLSIDESLLTGESIPVNKDESILLNKDTPIADQKNMAFMSTSVVNGSGTGIVIATGMNSQIGKIARLMKSETKEITPLQKKLNEISKVLAITTLILCGLIFTIALLQKRDFMEMLITAISLAVAVIPEGKGVLSWHSLLSKNKYQVTYQSYK